MHLYICVHDGVWFRYSELRYVVSIQFEPRYACVALFYWYYQHLEQVGG